MSDEQYTKRELDNHFKEIKESLDRIELQGEKADARLSSLENWRGYVLGFCGALIIVLPMLYSLMNLRISKIETDHVKNKSLLESLNK